LGRDSSDHNVLVLGQKLERLEAAGPLSVIFQVEGVDIELLEELLGDHVVASFGEKLSSDEVSAAEVHPCVEVGRQLADAVVIQLDVGVQKVVDGPNVVWILNPALPELV